MSEKFRITLFLVVAVLLLASITGCGADRDTEQQPGPEQTGTMENAHGSIPPVGVPVIEVPDAIKGKWKSVVLTVEDRSLGTNKDYTVEIGDTLEIPDSDLTVEVKEFFPAFLMQGSNITSASNNPENPAAKIEVKEGGSLVFDSWLFANYPTTHPFPHQRFGIILKEGIPS